MKNFNNSNALFRFLSITLSAILLLGSVPVFAGAKAALQGGTIYFDQLIETKQEKIIRTKVTGKQAADVTQDINVEYIQIGSSVTLAADKDFNGTILGTLTRHEYNQEGTRIAKSAIEATVSVGEIQDGKTDAPGLSAGESIDIFFDNETIPGITLGDSKALYELQLLFSPKNQKPFFYTYYLRLSTTEAAPTNTTKPAQEKKETQETAPNKEEIAAPANTTKSAVTETQTSPKTVSLNNTTTPTVQMNASTKAIPASTKVMVDGKIMNFEVYNIANYNYVKLRDFAMTLNGTPKTFSINWSKENNSISINSRSAYVAVGGELMISEGYTAGIKQSITPMKSTLLYDNTPIQLDGYIIKGNTFFMVRDLAKLMNTNITYDAVNNIMNVDTKTIYQQ